MKKLSESVMTKSNKKKYNMIMNGKSKQKERALFLMNKRNKLKKLNRLMGTKHDV